MQNLKAPLLKRYIWLCYGWYKSKRYRRYIYSAIDTGWLWGENRYDKILFFLLIPLPSRFHPFSHHSSGGNVVFRATGHRKRNSSVQRLCQTRNARLNSIACKPLYINILPETYQKNLFRAASTWTSLGTRIICRILVKYWNTINYINVVKIDLYPVLPKLSGFTKIIRRSGTSCIFKKNPMLK